MIYFDNASTTRIDTEVIKAMTESMGDLYGNPSSTHSLGRKSKVAIETIRNNISKILNCSSKDIIFTSGGTEGDNMIINNAIYNIKVDRIISSPIEHHAVLDAIKEIEKKNILEVVWLDVDDKGSLNLNQLQEIIGDGKKTFVSLMHVNNEIGNINDIYKIGDLCKKNNAIFHSDTVQSITKVKYDLRNTNIDFMCASAHKFGGPKGVGFIYKKSGIPFTKQISGGEQERNYRAGTENIQGIIGLGKAFEIAYNNFDSNIKHILDLKKHFISSIKEQFNGILFNGLSDNTDHSIPNILNIKLPAHKTNKMLAFQFDIKGIAISEGSACSAGNSLGSHVLNEINSDTDIGNNIRISFNRDNTTDEIDIFIRILSEILNK